LEQAGIPTAVVCSDEFAPLARAESQVLGMGALPLVPIPHPLAGNQNGLVAAKARAIAEEVLSALTDPADSIAARYEGRFLSLTERRLDGGAVCVDAACAIDPGVAGKAI
jgi:hypothetical protein